MIGCETLHRFICPLFTHANDTFRFSKLRRIMIFEHIIKSEAANEHLAYIIADFIKRRKKNLLTYLMNHYNMLE